MQRELDQLAPVFEASKTDVQLRHEAVEACQKEYAAAKDRCKKQEQDIEGMQGPIEILKKEAQAEFEKVSDTMIACLIIVLWKIIAPVQDWTRSNTLRFPPVQSLTVSFFQVNPLFDAAWKAINSLDIHDVEEIRSYRTPPAIVRLVVDAICVLFGKEQT